MMMWKIVGGLKVLILYIYICIYIYIERERERERERLACTHELKEEGG